MNMQRKRTKREVSAGSMRVRAYPVFHRAVEEGIAYGWRRAHKHTDAPSEVTIQEEILNAVVNSVCEQFEFDSELSEPD